MSYVHHYDPETDVDRVSGPDMDLLVRRKGAEVVGLTWKRPDHDPTGLIWRNGILDPPDDGFWPRHAPVLFPVVGGLHDNRSRTSDGIDVHFPGLHGLARHANFALSGASGGEHSFLLVYRLEASDETRALFPWNFTLTIVYTLRERELEQNVTVLNADDRPMPFQLGWHPGFPAPFGQGQKADCHLRLPQGRITRRLVDENCRLTGETEDLDGGGDFPFTEEGLDGTYLFDLSDIEPEQRVVELMDPDESLGVRVGLAGYPHLGLWSDARAPFVCIEPWQGMDDSVVQEPFDHKFGMVTLPPGTRDFRNAWIEAVEG